MPISYTIGDATEPQGPGPHAIVHINNNLGTWGGGFVLAVSDKWPVARRVYIDEKDYLLGDIQIVPVEDDILVINMIAQDDFPTNEFPVAVDYEALADCFWEISKRLPREYTIHAPRIGTGIAGGDWGEIESVIHRELSDYNVIIYDLPDSKFLTGLE
jgi:O-acetyl-ADP-ribose deacetylase (regulator of RNase III)